MKALIVRLSAIGDVVHTLPAAAALHQAGWSVGWVVEPAARVLLEGNAAVTHVFHAPPARAFVAAQARSALGQLRAERYDVALDSQGLWKSALWARLSGARRVIGYVGSFRREPASAWLMGERVQAPAGITHVIDKNLALLRPLGVDAVGTRVFPLPSGATHSAAVEAGLAAQGLGGRELVLLNPGGGWTSKLWPAERFGALAAGLRARGLTPLVTWGPGEHELAERVVAASHGAALACFPTTLLEYLELARRARLVVAADTGPMHLACALGRPVVALFGPTDPARNGPFATEDIVVRSRVPSCAPCHRRQCASHAGVMATIEVDAVLRAVDLRLAAGAKRMVANG
jgi:heptosyltransferase I